MSTMRRMFGTLGALVALFALSAPEADAQQRTRVQVEKDYGEVVSPRVDTVYMTRLDTVLVDREVIVTVYDTIIVREPQMIPARPEGFNFYWGLGGGAAIPGDNLEDAFNSGFNAMLLAGWQSQTTPWGLRLEGSYNQLSGDAVGGVAIDDGSVISGMIDLTANVPWGNERRSGFYLLGGVGVHTFTGFDIDEADFDPDVMDETEFITEESTEFGVNAGAGLRFAWGGTALFLEGKWVNVFTDNRDTRYFPITLGVTF